MTDTKQTAKDILEDYANCYSQVDLEQLANALDNIKAEAVKEFAEKVKQKTLAMVFSPDVLSFENYCECIDNLVKEMVGDTE